MRARLLTVVTHVEKNKIRMGAGKWKKGTCIFHFDHLKRIIIAKIRSGIICVILNHLKNIK